MKTQETISLNIGATILAGLLSSLCILFMSHGASLVLVASPFAFSVLAAFFQYRFVMEPPHPKELVTPSPGTKLLVTCSARHSIYRSRHQLIQERHHIRWLHKKRGLGSELQVRKINLGYYASPSKLQLSDSKKIDFGRMLLFNMLSM